MLSALQDMAVKQGKFKVYTSEDIPPEWNMLNDDRFGPILIIADPGYAFQDEFNLTKWVEETTNKPSKTCDCRQFSEKKTTTYI